MATLTPLVGFSGPHMSVSSLSPSLSTRLVPSPPASSASPRIASSPSPDLTTAAGSAPELAATAGSAHGRARGRRIHARRRAPPPPRASSTATDARTGELHDEDGRHGREPPRATRMGGAGRDGAPAHGSERSSPAAARARGSCPRRLAELSRNLAFYQDRSTKWIARANQKARFHGQDLFTSGSNPLFSCLIFLIHSLAMQLEVKRRMGRGNKKPIYVCLLSFSNAAA